MITPCFTQESISALFDKPKVVIQQPQRYVYIKITAPCGSEIANKRTHDFSMVAVCGPDRTIVGMDAYEIATFSDWRDRTVAFVRGLRDMPMLANSILMFTTETTTGESAGDIERIIRQNFQDVTFRCDRVKPGMNTINQNANDMMEMTRILLLDGKIGIAEGWVTTDKHPFSILVKLHNQALAFERIVVPSSNPLDKNQIVKQVLLEV